MEKNAGKLEDLQAGTEAFEKKDYENAERFLQLILTETRRLRISRTKWESSTIRPTGSI
jgi:hypothetical protein